MLGSRDIESKGHREVSGLSRDVQEPIPVRTVSEPIPRWSLHLNSSDLLKSIALGNRYPELKSFRLRRQVAQTSFVLQLELPDARDTGTLSDSQNLSGRDKRDDTGNGRHEPVSPFILSFILPRQDADQKLYRSDN
jgi:hypothetical protein